MKKSLIFILGFGFLTSFSLNVQAEISKNPVELKVYLTNTTYFLGNSILAEVIFKNVSAQTIKFHKDLGVEKTIFMYRLERAKAPLGIDGEPYDSRHPLPLIDFDARESEWRILKPNEEYKFETDLKELVDFWQLKEGKHYLKLVFRHTILLLENGKFKYAENEKRQIKNWPSEPFTLTLKSPKSPTLNLRSELIN